ncbi:MAG: ABC transporter ATP-binding protein, partial [Anaerolineae bacterium]|nr:ABC transporter ATP-binding protein [Thermoflexales bacterium]MDW8408880.1 ABC transporter ATP-binding protein [Anaerolineae bacterium]
MADIEFYEWGYAYPSAARPALSGVNCVLHPTQFTLVIGESGAGKSTLVRAMNGLVPHFTGGRVTGRLRVAGLDPVSAGPSRMALHVGMVFQDPESQFVLDTVEDEVAFALENAAIPRPEMRRRVEETLGLLGISHLRQRTIHTLSGGEQQRVAIASALVLQPAILALDEPTSQLDPESAAGVLDALADLNRSGLAIVLVEHRLERVVPFANAVMRVEGGTAMVGPPAEMLNGSPIAPPTVELARALGLHPLPLTLPALVTALTQKSTRLTAQPTSDTLPAQRRTSIGNPILRLQGVCAAYGDCPVLYGIDLTAREGEIIALIGRNGHGKSTLLKTIIGLVRPSAGAIWLDGKRIDNQDTTTI